MLRATVRFTLQTGVVLCVIGIFALLENWLGGQVGPGRAVLLLALLCFSAYQLGHWSGRVGRAAHTPPKGPGRGASPRAVGGEAGQARGRAA